MNQKSTENPYRTTSNVREDVRSRFVRELKNERERLGPAGFLEWVEQTGLIIHFSGYAQNSYKFSLSIARTRKMGAAELKIDFSRSEQANKIIQSCDGVYEGLDSEIKRLKDAARAKLKSSNSFSNNPFGLIFSAGRETEKIEKLLLELGVSETEDLASLKTEKNRLYRDLARKDYVGEIITEKEAEQLISNFRLKILKTRDILHVIRRKLSNVL